MVSEKISKLDPIIFIKGSIIGIANIIPGVSGGTLAVVLGVYSKLVEAIGNVFTFNEKTRENALFLAQIGLGALLAIFLLSNLIDFFYETFEDPTIFFFIGLIIGSVPTVLRQHTDMRPTIPNFIFFLIGFVIVAIISYYNGTENGGTTVNGSMALLFISGIAAAAAMIVPGFSGSFVLVMLGVYWDLIDAVKTFDILYLIPPAIGGVIGLVGVSKGIDIILKKYPSKFYYFILGLIIGSLFGLYPGLPANSNLVGSIITFAVGLGISLKLSK